MVDPHRAWAIISSAVAPLSRIRLGIAASAGYVLAENVRADRDLPPADRSAMDGYAVRAYDLTPPCFLKLAGEVAAGSPARPRVTSGACVRILTGANIPPGADSVVMVEDTKEAGRRVEIRSQPEPGANILRRGEDARKGQILIRKGAVLDSARIGVCASVGRAEIKVFRRPRLTVLCTGAELKAPAATVRPHQLRNSNGPAICSALALGGFGRAAYRSLPDKVGRLAVALRQASRRYDVIVLTGGMSVGKYDVVRKAVEQIGARVRLHGVAMKPGKPFLFATLPGNRFIFGLPGNPLSALTGLHEFVLPALRRMSGMNPQACCPCLRLPLGSGLTSKGGRARYILGRLSLNATMSCNAQCVTSVVPVESRSSADLVSAGRADGAIIVPANATRLNAGKIIAFRPWRTLP